VRGELDGLCPLPSSSLKSLLDSGERKGGREKRKERSGKERVGIQGTHWDGGRCTHFYKWLGTGSTVSIRTANKKLTKLY